MAVDTPVHRDEKIKTSQSGLGQFLFRDGTKLAVGWGSSVTIDKFVYDDTDSGQEIDYQSCQGDVSLDQRKFEILGLSDFDPCRHDWRAWNRIRLLCGPRRNDSGRPLERFGAILRCWRLSKN